MARRRSFSTNVGKVKRQVTWVGPADQTFVAVATGGATIVATFDPSALGMLKPTVVRTRGDVSIIPNSVGADLNIVGAYGLAIVSDQAVAIGVTGIPTPWTDPSWDGWFVWRSFGYRVENSTSVSINSPLNISHEVDSKAMRKITDNETMVMVAESQAGAFNISMALRTLLKLS